MYRSWMKNQGIPDHEFQGKPIIGICNTWSELTPCNAHFRKLAEHVQARRVRSRRLPGRVPGVLATASRTCGRRRCSRATSPAWTSKKRSAATRSTRVVLLVGCDKTTPALLMGAASCDVPAIVVSGGPMLNGKLDGRDIGSGTAVWQLHEAGQGRARSPCTSSCRPRPACRARPAPATPWARPRRMACMAEALGVTLPHNAAIPAVDARRYVLAHMSGMRIVEMVLRGPDAVEDPHPRSVRERDPHQRRDRRLDQRGDPPEGDRRAHRRAARTRRLDAHRPRHADAGRPACPRAAS